MASEVTFCHELFSHGEMVFWHFDCLLLLFNQQAGPCWPLGRSNKFVCHIKLPRLILPRTWIRSLMVFCMGTHTFECVAVPSWSDVKFFWCFKMWATVKLYKSVALDAIHHNIFLFRVVYVFWKWSSADYSTLLRNILLSRGISTSWIGFAQLEFGTQASFFFSLLLFRLLPVVFLNASEWDQRFVVTRSRQ